MLLTLIVLASIRVCVAVISVLVSIVILICACRKACQKDPLPLQESALIASLLILNCALGLPGTAVNSSNSALLILNIAAIISLLVALNLFVWRATQTHLTNQSGVAPRDTP